MHRQSNPHRRRRHAIAATAIGLVCAAVFAPGASAQTLKPSAYGAMLERVAAAEWIVVADLVEMPVRRSARDHRLVTDYHFTAMRTLFGHPPPDDLVLSEERGSLEDESPSSADAPVFVLGARYLLFVRPRGNDLRSTIVGGAQGVYRLSIDGKAMALGGEREILDGGDLLAEIDRLVATRKGPERIVPAHSATPGY
jgi:hypothetical protein